MSNFGHLSNFKTAEKLENSWELDIWMSWELRKFDFKKCQILEAFFKFYLNVDPTLNF